jgi:hypothetical protein
MREVTFMLKASPIDRPSPKYSSNHTSGAKPITLAIALIFS